MKLIEMTLTGFVDTTASDAPAPGGGAVSALEGALGAALTSMVCALTLGKKKYAAVQDDITRLMDASLELQADLLGLIDKDARAFEPLAKAYSLPSSTEEEKAEKARVMAVVLKDACDVPMEIMVLCCRALDLIAEYAQKGSVIAISDAGVAAALCVSALKGASLNVFINTKSMADRALADSLNKRAEAMLAEYVPMGDDIFATVRARLAKKEK